MSVLGDSTRKGSSSLLVATAIFVCLSATSSSFATKGKYKSLDRLKIGLQSVLTAKAATSFRLSQLQAERNNLQKVKPAEGAFLFSEKTSADVRQFASTVLRPAPASMSVLRGRLQQQLKQGEIKLLAQVLMGEQAVIASGDVEDAITQLASIDEFRKRVGIKSALTQVAEPEDAERNRIQEVDEQIDFLRSKLAKCERDEKHIRAEMRVVSSHAFQDELPSRRVATLQRPIETRQTSGFGMREHPIHHEERMHKGVDFAGPYGTRVTAAATGKVVFAGQLSGYGNIVVIAHKDGLETAYAHLSQINVEVGDRIGAGYKIGEVGATGLATGPHLHFEVRVNGKQVDPSDYL